MKSFPGKPTALRDASLLAALLAIAAPLPPAQAQTPADTVTTLRELPQAAQRSPLRRHRYFYERKAFPNERIPPGALRQAVEQHEAAFGPLRAPESAPLDADPTDFFSGQTKWTELGPKPINTSMTTSGRINTIAVNPSNTNVMYLGAATGGVWKTTDGGANWLPLTDTQCSLAMGSIALDPSNPEIVYAGTGEENFSGDSYYGCGILKSTNGGANWTRLGASTFAPTTNGATIGKIAIHPTSTNVLVAAASNGLQRSTDSGATWALVNAGVATDVVIDPTNGANMYAANGNIFGSASNGVFRSTNAGATWTKVAGGFPTTSVGRINLAISASSPATLYAAVQSSSTFGLLGVWKSTDAGANWTQLAATGASCNTQCWYDMGINVDPTNANIVYFSGFSIYRSTDGGASFSNIGSTIHVDHHGFAFHPGTPTTIYAGSDGGIFKSTNSGSTWTSLNATLGITQFYAGHALHPTNPSVFMGGTQDNGTVATTGSLAWSPVIGGDGGFAAIDQSSPNVAYGETQWGASSGFSGPRRSSTFGSTNSFSLATNGINLADSAEFIPPLIMSQSTSSTLYFGTNKVYKTTDGAANWVASGTTPGGTITYIAEAPGNSSIVYMGTRNGVVYKSSNSNATYAAVGAGLPTRTPTYIVVHPTDANTVFVTFSGFGGGHIYKSTNGGASWTNISGNLPDLPVNSMAIDPAAPTSEIYVGTDLGVYRTRNGGATWAAFNNGLPNTPVHDLKYNATTGVLVAATHGRGVWKATPARTPVYAIVGAGDVNGDGKKDIFIRQNIGNIGVWLSSGMSPVSAGGFVGPTVGDWDVVGTGKFDPASPAGLLLFSEGARDVAAWGVNGLSLGNFGFVTRNLEAGWIIAGVGDFNGDGKPDVVVHNKVTGWVGVWTMNGLTLQSGALVFQLPLVWTIAGVGDFDGDGKADMILYNPTNGSTAIWLMDGPVIKTPAVVFPTVDLNFSIVGVGDLDGDGKADVVVRSKVTGDVGVWLMDGVTFRTAAMIGNIPLDGTVNVVADIDGDGRADIVHRRANGDVVVWKLAPNGLAFQSAATIASVP